MTRTTKHFVRRALLVSSGLAISVLVLTFFVSWPPAGAAENLALGAATLAITGLSFGALQLLLDRRHIVLYFRVAESVGRDEVAVLGRLPAGAAEALARLRGESTEGRWTPSVFAPYAGLALSGAKPRIFIDASEGLTEIPGDLLIEAVGYTFFGWHRYPSITLRESTSGSRVTLGLSRPRLFQVGPLRARDRGALVALATGDSPERFRYHRLMTTVKSSLGYSVCFRGVSQLVYESAVDTCVIPCEMLYGPRPLTLALAVYGSSVKDVFSVPREEILGRVRKAGEFAGWQLEFDE